MIDVQYQCNSHNATPATIIIWRSILTSLYVLVFFANQQPHVLWPWTACFFTVVICSLKCATTTWSQMFCDICRFVLLCWLCWLFCTAHQVLFHLFLLWSLAPRSFQQFWSKLAKTTFLLRPCAKIEYSWLKFARTRCDALCWLVWPCVKEWFLIDTCSSKQCSQCSPKCSPRCSSECSPPSPPLCAPKCSPKCYSECSPTCAPICAPLFAPSKCLKV